MFKLGLKLWSTNKNYVDEARRLYDGGVFDYIELFSVPDTYSEFISTWKSLNIPYIIHGPHYTTGLNFADKDCFEKNMKLAAQAQRFADALGAEIIIFHPGVAGDIDQTIFQLNKINDSRIVIENKPYFAIMNNLICNGTSPQEIEKILEETKVGFCLDIAHAICAANALKKKQVDFIKDFLRLNPLIYHLSDNEWECLYDAHKHLGLGSFNLKEIIALLPQGSKITLETPKDFQNSLQDFEQDALFFKSLY